MITALQRLLDDFNSYPNMPMSRSLMIHLIKKQMPQEKKDLRNAVSSGYYACCGKIMNDKAIDLYFEEK